MRMHDDEVAIDAALVRRLVVEQFPEYADLAIRKVEPWGTDNAIWRLGDELVVRMPRIESAVEQIAFEAQWLPWLDAKLTVEVPTPIAVGAANDLYPYRWAIHRWLPGLGAGPATIGDPVAFALDLAHVVRELRPLPVDGVRPARNRARPIQDYDKNTRQGIASAAHLIDADAATAIWERALAAEPHQGVTWVHGDLEGNCLVSNGRLSGLIDWGIGCVGDPAVDIQVAWSPLFTAESRGVFLDALKVDDATIARAQGAAINQACWALPYYFDTYPLIVERSWHKLTELGVDRL